MWILDSDGDFLHGKRVWLRPGKKYLFGRIKQDGVRHAIQHASISRKHLVIEISPVKPGDGSHIHTRSEITVGDQDSKCGTIVDGEQIKGQTKRLKGEEHEIKLGRYQHALRIRWEDVVFSFSFSSKELKAKDPLGPVRSRLEDLDVKTIIPYVVGKTTHVVQSKRNTAKGLQALINAKHIVQESYIDALVYAATPGDLENMESLSPLEEDFDAAWPDPSEHLPPPGKEPVHRPAAAFAPNPDRINVFEGYTFVFCDVSQFDNLQAPINNGHGKALFYQIENGRTTAEEIVQFMRNAAGQKGLGSEREGPGGIVLVRFRAKGHYEEWSIELGNQVALMMDQRVIEQSEFLDAILGNDASPLCRPLPRDPAPSQDSTPREPSVPPEPAPPSSVEPPSQPLSQPLVEDSQPAERPAKRPRVRSFVSKVKTFDDGFDMESIPAYTLEDGEEPQAVPESMEMDAVPSQPQPQPTDRAAPGEDDIMSNLLPGANAMKRRRAEMRQHHHAEPTPTPDTAPPKPKRQRLDVLEAARQHRQAEEIAARERRQEEEASLQASLQGMTIAEMKSLAVVEETEVPSRVSRAARTAEAADEGEDRRWDDNWNGRKNFKKFRRKGDPNAPRVRVQTVIVPLEEFKRKDYGIGDVYWAGGHNHNQSHSHSDSNNVPNSRKSSNREGQVSQVSLGQLDTTTAEESVSVPASQPSAPASAATREETPPPRTTTRTTRTGTGSRTQTQRTQKRTREEVRDSDSEDELRFRFRRKR